MSLKNKVENHPLVFFFSTLCAGFIAGLATYQTILSIANLDTVRKNEYELKNKINSKYISLKEHQDLMKSITLK